MGYQDKKSQGEQGVRKSKLVLEPVKPTYEPGEMLRLSWDFEGKGQLQDILRDETVTVDVKGVATKREAQVSDLRHTWKRQDGEVSVFELRDKQAFLYEVEGPPGYYELEHEVWLGDNKVGAGKVEFVVQQKIGQVDVRKRRTRIPDTDDIALWAIIEASTDAMSFRRYQATIDQLLCGKESANSSRADEVGKYAADRLGVRSLPYTDTDAYRLLKIATEAYVMIHCAVDFDLDQAVPRGFDLSSLNTESGQRLDRNSINSKALYDGYLAYINGSGRGTSHATLPYFALLRERLADEKLVGLADSIFPTNGDRESSIVAAFPQGCFGLIKEKLTKPCFIELIWSYWHEEGMLVQTMNAISRRFQNIRGKDSDPLVNFETDPLRPLNNLLWGYIKDEQHRLSLTRRNYEYDHHYGIRLLGRAVRDFRPADSRSKFVEAFHHLLYLTIEFYHQDDDTNVIADGFPVLNGLKEVHTVLTEGQHNQYGDLPSTARIEMLMQQWLLARPEFREFLPTRIMVALPEPWMPRVDSMKNLQGWTDASSLHYLNLAQFGERLLLSCRFSAWNIVDNPDSAANWARFWRREVQGYMHAYRAVAGVDLTQEPVDYGMPALHLQDRLVSQVHRR